MWTWSRNALLFAFLLPSVVSATPESLPGEFVVSVPATATHAAQRVPSGFHPIDIGREHLTLRRNASTAGVAQVGCEEILAQLPPGSLCSPNFIYELDRTPNDTLFPSLIGLESRSGVDIDATSAWELDVGSREIIVATIDSGADYTHPDLAQNIWRNPREIPGNGIDDDGNGYIDDVHGANTGAKNNLNQRYLGDPSDTSEESHGTHIAGTIGAVGDNSFGVVGVNWQVQIMPIAAFNGSTTSLSDILAAIDYILQQKSLGENVVAVNASFGGPGFSAPFEQAIQRLKSAGILLVASAGNFGLNNDVNPRYPSSYDIDNVIAVAAADAGGALASFSHYGATQVDLAAPGDEILSTLRGGGYGLNSGTSMAAPHVTGAIALLSSYRPGIAALEMRRMLFTSVVPIPALAGKVATGGVLNLLNLLTEPLPPATPTPSPTPTPTGSISVNDGRFRFLELGSGISFRRRFQSSRPLSASIIREDFLSRPGRASARLLLVVNGVQCDYYGTLKDTTAPVIHLSGKFKKPRGRNAITILLGNDEEITDSARVTILPKSRAEARPVRTKRYVNGLCKRFLESLAVS